MPVNRNRDIYGANPRSPSPRDAGHSAPQKDSEWIRQTRGSPWSAVLFSVLILVFLTFLLAVILYQQRQIRQARVRPAPPPTVLPGLGMEPQERTRMDWDPEGRLMLEEGPEREPAPVGEGPYPFTVEWVQEAALHVRRAEAAYRAGQWREALEHYGAAGRIFPDLQGISAPQGLCHLRLREFDEAEAVFSAERDHGAVTPGLLNNLAVAQMGQGRDEAAGETLREAIQLNPEYIPAQHNLALLYHRTGDLDAAAAAFREMYRRRPLTSDHAHMYALTLLKLERWDEAATVLRESVRLYPQAPPIRFRLAEALAHLPDPVSAVDALREAVALVDARHAMRWINRSEFDPLRMRPEFQELVAELAGVLR